MQQKPTEFAIESVTKNELVEALAPTIELCEIALREEMATISICTYNIAR